MISVFAILMALSAGSEVSRVLADSSAWLRLSMVGLAGGAVAGLLALAGQTILRRRWLGMGK